MGCFTLLDSVHLNWIPCRTGRTKMCVNCMLNKAYPHNRLYAVFFKKKSFSGFIKKVVTWVSSEDLNRFYKAVSFHPFFFLFLSKNGRQNTKGSRGYKCSHHQLLLGF